LADGVREHALANEAPPFPSDLTIVWIGRFLPLKAARLAVESFRLLHQEEPRARLVMIGDGPTRGSTRECAADLERRGLVNFTGQLPWASAQKILASARVHLFTSVRDSFGAQILEASSVGVPTVAIDAYGAKAFLHRRGFGLADPLPGNSLDVRLAQQLLKFSTLNERQWREESRGALQFAGENRYRERASLLLSRYEELTKRPLRPEVGRT
jgi:glycosyltransferase involved in cell wall biosynthesis